MQLQVLQVRPLGGMRPSLPNDTSAVKQMVCASIMNTFVLPGAIVAEVEGDIRGWGMNLLTLPRETLYQLQDGVITELHVREGRTLQILMEHKENLEKVSLQCDDLVTHKKELE